MSSTPYFPFFPGDYLADTIGLSCCEHGVYLLLLAVSWQRGPLPDDIDHLARLAANPPIEAIRNILQNYWTLEERGWINKRLETVREKVLQKSEKARVSAGKRWRDANAMRTHSERNAIQSQSQSQSQKEDKERKKPSRPAFVPPSVADVQMYAKAKMLDVDAEEFVDHFTSNGWKVGGKAPMKDWRAAVRNWHRRNGKNKPGQNEPTTARRTAL